MILFIILVTRQDGSNPYLSDPDVILMIEFQKGDKASFETLMRKYYPKIVNFVYRFVNNKEVAEDLAQDIFMRVYKSAKSYTPQSKFQTWVFTIAKNASLNELRKSKFKGISLDETYEGEEGKLTPQVEDPKAETAGEQMLKEERLAVIKTAIQSLPENQRMAVLLRRYENFSYDEIAATMGTSVEAVKSLLSRAKENLKERLKGLDKA